eukprot:GEMP01037493.1.p1 GENE.GEMP01037493.1~~GEMP01037493.1.p1  ORF type:complete len:434 (+),score=92.00 GEMP01037493.1:95-1396(+)
MAGSSLETDAANDVATLPATSQAALKLPKLFPLPPLHLVKPDGTVVTTKERIAAIEAEIPRQYQMLDHIRHSRQMRAERLAVVELDLERSSVRRKVITQNNLLRLNAILCIQSSFRGLVVRRWYRKALLAAADDISEEDVEDERKALMYVQLKNLRRVIHDMAFSNPVIRDQFASKIQLWWRRMLHSRRVAIVKLYEAYRADWKEKMTQAQIRISRWVRRWVLEYESGKRVDSEDSDEARDLNSAVRLVQACWRRHVSCMADEDLGGHSGGKPPVTRKSKSKIRTTQSMLLAKSPDKKVDHTSSVAPTELRREPSCSVPRERADQLVKAKASQAAAPPPSPSKRRKAVEIKAAKKVRAIKPKKAIVFFDTQYQDDLEQTVARLRLTENVKCSKTRDAASRLSEKPIVWAHPLLDSTMLAANPHYISLARSLFN